MKQYIGKSVNLVMNVNLTPSKDSFEDIVSKYGAKIWNGDKICGELLAEGETIVTIIAIESGSMENVYKTVKVLKSDIRFITTAAPSRIKNIVIWRGMNYG